MSSSDKDEGYDLGDVKKVIQELEEWHEKPKQRNQKDKRSKEEIERDLDSKLSQLTNSPFMPGESRPPLPYAGIPEVAQPLFAKLQKELRRMEKTGDMSELSMWKAEKALRELTKVMSPKHPSLKKALPPKPPGDDDKIEEEDDGDEDDGEEDAGDEQGSFSDDEEYEPDSEEEAELDIAFGTTQEMSSGTSGKALKPSGEKLVRGGKRFRKRPVFKYTEYDSDEARKKEWREITLS